MGIIKLALGLVVGMAVLAVLIAPLLVLVDAARRPSSDWSTAQRSKPAWVAFIFFFHLIGSAAYLYGGTRDRLVEVEAERLASEAARR